MARNRPFPKKIRLGKKLRSNDTVPTWVVLRTRRRFRTHPKKRRWRSTKIKP